MKAIRIIGILSLIAVSFSSGVMAQQERIPKNPFRFTDAVTGKPIPEVLVLPRYFSAKGIFMAPEGHGKRTSRNYLDKPFLYRADTPFILKTPKFCGLPLFPVFIGKAGSVEGILIVAPKYRPLWFDNLWQTRDIWNTRDMRNLLLDPISDEEWSLLLEHDLSPLIDQSVRSVDDFGFWGLHGDWSRLYVDYSKRERELIKKFLANHPPRPPNKTGLESKYFQSTT